MPQDFYTYFPLILILALIALLLIGRFVLHFDPLALLPAFAAALVLVVALLEGDL